MNIIDFEIENFKGINNTRIEISTKAPGNIVTLIGLNESGKTTILEAISNFVSVDRETSDIVKTVVNSQGAADLIPKTLKPNFTGEISIKANLVIDDSDIDDLADFMLTQHNIQIDKKNCPRSMYVKKCYVYVDSDYVTTKSIWSPAFQGTKGKGKKVLTISGGQNRDLWAAAIDFLGGKFPKIVYFPTFMFNMPDRVYLEDHPSWAKNSQALVINRYFKQVLQDVADSLNSNISLQTHIVDRIARHRDEVTNPLQFLATFLGLDAATQINAVTNRLSSKIGRVVFEAWNEISGKSVAGKTVRVVWSVDAEAKNIPFLKLYIHDGEDDFAIHERSLGFRWFFTFLLFTQFRASRKSERGTIFLFDEPAANLHARAQTKLLESFSRIATGNKFIVYSTHSHYMIDPMWLEKAVIVENTAVDFDEEDDGDFETKATNIIASRYRSFVAANPERVSYFQPALDALKFSFGPLLPGRNALIVEGKYDFHPLRYFQRRFEREDFSIIPAPSASEAGTLISLLRGMGTNFVVMLDDDGAGRRAAKVYRETHLLGEDRVFTIARFEPECTGKPFEELYSQEVKHLAGAQGWKAQSKGELSLLFQELLMKKNFTVDLGETEGKALKIFGGIFQALALPAMSRQSKSKPKSKASLI